MPSWTVYHFTVREGVPGRPERLEVLVPEGHLPQKLLQFVDQFMSHTTHERQILSSEILRFTDTSTISHFTFQ